MLLQAGALEMLSADAEYYATAARAAGAHCEVELWDGMFHVFQIMRWLPQAHRAYRSVERFVASLDALRAAKTA